MVLRILSSPGQLRPRDLLIDSSWSEVDAGLPGVMRVDHHVDGGWTQIDSIAAAGFTTEVLAERARICSSYLDPDAILGAALLLSVDHSASSTSLREHPLFPVFYSAAFWADHNTACPYLTTEHNNEGSRLEAWLRHAYSEALGREDRADAPSDVIEYQSSVFQDLADVVGTAWSKYELPDACLQFDHAAYLARARDFYNSRIRHDLCSESLGVIDATNVKRSGPPRAYLPLFRQPIVLRIIRGISGSQLMLGVNPNHSDWCKLDLCLLEEPLAGLLPDWSPTGRRGVIGGRTSITVDKVASVLRKVELTQAYTENPQWTVLDSATFPGAYLPGS